MRHWIEQLDLDRLVAECAAISRFDESTTRDALLDVLSAMWTKQDEYQDKFSSLGGVAQYIKVAVIRHLVRLHGHAKQAHSFDLEGVADSRQTPEEQVVALLSHQYGTQWLEQAKNSLNRREAQALQQLMQKVLQAPETYIKTRQSGEESGRYAFHYSRLADALGWSRRKVYERLETLRQALLSQRTARHGEER